MCLDTSDWPAVYGEPPSVWAVLGVFRSGTVPGQAGVKERRLPYDDGDERREMLVDEKRLHVSAGEQQRVAQVGERVDGGPSPVPSDESHVKTHQTSSVLTPPSSDLPARR